LRCLSAATLGVMVPLNPGFMVHHALPELVKMTQSEMVNTRHGSLYAIGDILLGLGGQCDKHNCANYMKDSIFLRSLSKNEAKLVEAGEYKQKFNESYDVLKK